MKYIFKAVAYLCFTLQVSAQFAGKYASVITAEALKEKLSYIAGSETEGRESGTKGQRLAAAYIAQKFKEAGLLPGTTAGYQMIFPLYQDTLLDLSLSVNNKKLTVQQDYFISFNALPSMYAEAGEVVFASYGIVDSLRDDYSGLDVKNKWVVVLEGTDAKDEKAARPSRIALANAIASKVKTAESKGAKGLFIITSGLPVDAPAVVRGSKYVKKKPSGLPFLYIAPSVAASMLSVVADSLSEFKNVPSGTYKTDVALNVYKYTLLYPSTNVIGLLPGTDKADEYIVLTAHYDHIGMRNGVIYPGADDDGSGTVAVMQMAEAFAKAKAEGNGPRRSIIFMAVSGEEMGLLGSAFYTDHPLYPLEKTSVNLNIDMIGRVTRNPMKDSLNYVYLIGDDRLSSELAPLVDSANESVGLHLDRSYNGNDPYRYYFRSDHYNFAKNGVPIIFFYNGTHVDYHRPGDTIDKINFDLLVKRARLVFHTASIMANTDEMLKRDIPMKE